MASMSEYGAPIWSQANTSFLAGTFAVGQVLYLFHAYYPNVGFYWVALFSDMVLSGTMIFLSYRWLYLMYAKIYVQQTTLTINESYCNAHLVAMLIGLFSFWAVYLAYPNTGWAGLDGGYLATLTYVELVYTVVLSMWSGRIARKEFYIAQVDIE